LSSSATVPPASQATTPGRSFQAVLANASTEGSLEPRTVSYTAKTPLGQKAGDHAVDETAPAGLVALESGETDAVEGTRGEHWAATSDTTGAISSLATATTAATAGATATSTDVSVAVEASADGYFRQGIVGASVSDGGSVRSSIEDAGVPVASSGAVRVPGKQDRPKALTDLKDVSTQTTAGVAVVDQSRIPVVNLVSWQGSAHGGGSEASGNPAKSGAAESSAGTGGKPAASVDRASGASDGVADGAAGAVVLPSVAAGFEQGVLMQAPAEMVEAGLDVSTLSALSGNSELTSNANGGQATGKSVPKGAAAVGDSGGLSGADGVSSTKSATGGVGDTSSRAVANSTQTAQSLQGELSKPGTGGIVPRATENGAVQTPMQAVSHDGATAQRTVSGASDGAHTGKAQDLPASAHLADGDAVAASGINSAKLIQTMGETEMHVGMHSAEFGDISIRTSLSQQQMVTQISLDHNDLSQTISAHLSAVQAKLGEEYGLHASIEINNQGAPLSSGQGDSSQRGQQPFARSSPGKSVGSVELNESVSSVVALTSAGSGHGLDIRV
jgi:hypothetical protein